MDALELSVFNIVGNAFCVEADDGQKVFDHLSAALKAGRTVALSFQNVEMLTSAFLNTAVGQLYRDFPEELVRERLQAVEMDAVDLALLKRVVETAKLFYKDPERLQKSINEVMEN